MHERMAATVGLGIGLRLKLLAVRLLFSVLSGGSRAVLVVVVVVRRRKLTRFRNDGLLRIRDELKSERVRERRSIGPVHSRRMRIDARR